MLDYTSILKYLPITTATTADYILINSAGNNKKILLSDFISTLGLGAGITLTTTGTSGASTLVSGTLNIPQYQGQLTLTTTGTSGAATLVGTTLNIPQYGGGGVTAVTGSSPISSSGGSSPNITISKAKADGTTLGAATFRASDFDDDGSGLISIDYTNGSTANSSQNGFLSSTDWTTFNNKQNAITLTTTGTSGASTLVGSTLNIPQYSFTGVTSVTGTSPIASSGGTTPAISIADAAADGSTKGAAAFNASDFNSASGIISLDYTNAQKSSASNTGFLSSTDWSTFNSKQGALTLTTTGTSGAATLVGSTLNIPQYSGGGITTLNTLTGATQTFATGTTGTDFGISSSGTTHTFNIPTASASNRGLLSTTDWSTFNGKQSAITLTTTGTSGAATFISNTLNIPQYSGGSGTAVDIQTAYGALGSAIKGFNIINPSNFVSAGTSPSSGFQWFIPYYLPQSATITGVKWYQAIVGNYTANNYNGVGLYSYSGGTLTLVASSTNDGTIWQQAGAAVWKLKAFSSNYSASAGIYFISFLYSNSASTTNPSLGVWTSLNAAGVSSFDFTNSAKFVSYISSTSFPSTQAMSGTTGSTTNWTFFLY